MAFVSKRHRFLHPRKSCHCMSSKLVLLLPYADLDWQQQQSRKEAVLLQMNLLHRNEPLAPLSNKRTTIQDLTNYTIIPQWQHRNFDADKRSLLDSLVSLVPNVLCICVYMETKIASLHFIRLRHEYAFYSQLFLGFVYLTWWSNYQCFLGWLSSLNIRKRCELLCIVCLIMCSCAIFIWNILGLLIFYSNVMAFILIKLRCFATLLLLSGLLFTLCSVLYLLCFSFS